MFVIADARHSKVPNYLLKVLPFGTALITVELIRAVKFDTRQDAKELIATIQNNGQFEFKVYELTIKM